MNKSGTNPASVEPRFDIVDLFRPHEDIVGFRVPQLVVTPKGTVLAFVSVGVRGLRDAGTECYTAVRRSHDNGRSWGDEQRVMSENTHQTSAVVDQETGRTMLLAYTRPLRDGEGNPMHENWMMAHPQETWELGGRVLQWHSDDDGVIWSEPRDLGQDLWLHPSGGLIWTIGHGIQFSQGPYRGRLVIPSRHFGAGCARFDEDGRNMVHFSDDHGETWHLGGTAQPYTGECCLAELSDGSLYLNSRNHGQMTGCRAWCISSNGGETFTQFGYDKTLIESRVHAGVTRYSSAHDGVSRILFCNPATREGRHSMTVRVSYDECKTWPVSRVIDRGFTAYSDICVANDGTILCAYEAVEGYKEIKLARLNLRWLEAGRK